MSDVSPSVDIPVLATEACWKKIGIWGNKQCAELAQHTHCRNCPVFSAGAAQLMDRALPADYQAQWTAHFTDKKADTVLSTLSILIFKVAQEAFALSMRVLQEVAYAKEIRSLPHRRRQEVLGLVNVRGELVVTVSLSRALGIEPADSIPSQPLGRELREEQRLLIVSHDGHRLAFVVQGIMGIARINMGELKDLPATVVHSGRRCVSGVLPWGGMTVGFLDEQRLFQTVNRNLG